MPSTQQKTIFLFFWFYCVLFNTNILAQETANFSVNGFEVRCYNDSIVEITVVPNAAFNFTSIDIYWEDGTNETILPGGTFIRTHTYSTYQFPEECTYPCQPPPTAGFCFRIELFAYYSDAPDENNSKIITFKTPPRVDFEPNNTTICVGDEICFTNETCPDNDDDMIYLWDFGNGTTSSATDTCLTYLIAGTYNVTLTATNTCGTDTRIKTVTVRPAPTLDITFNETNAPSNTDTVACTPYTVTFTNSSADATGFHWEITHEGSEVLDSLTSETTPLTYTFDMSGTYIVYLELLSDCGNLTWEQLFTLEAGPGVTLNPQAPTCETNSYTPNVTYGGGDIDTYAWDFGLGMPSTSSEPSPVGIEFPGEGTYPISLTINSECEGEQVFLDTFIIIPQEMAMISIGDTEICSLDGDFTLTATPEGGEWMINGTIIFNGTIDPTLYTATPQPLMISYGLEPCITTDMIELTIISADIGMPDDQEVCLDEPPVTFTATPPGGEWSGPGITPGGIFDPTLTGLGTFTLYYEITNATLPSCSNIDSFMVTVSQLMVDFAVDTCFGTTLCFDTISTSNFSNILWDFDGLGTSNQVAPCFTFPSAQSYEVSVTIQQGACDAMNTHTVAIEEAPMVDFALTYNNDMCSPLAVTFQNNSTGGNNLNYEWLLNGAVFSTDETPSSITLAAYAQDTLFEITLNISNDCATVTQTENILVMPRPVSLFGTDLNQYCSGDTIQLANVSFGNPDTYEWFLNNVSISTDSIEPIISYITDIVDTISICLVTTNSCGVDTLCLNIEVIPTTVNAFFNTSPDHICAGDTVWFTNFATQGVPVFYDFGDNNSTSTPNPFHIYQNVGSYLVVQQAFGCGHDSFEQMITVHEPPTAAWINPVFGCPGAELFFENTSLDVMIYAWDFGDSTSISTVESPYHTFTTAGPYEVCLTVSSSEVDGCSNTFCQTVQIHQAPIPGFTFTDSLCVDDTVLFTSTASSDVLFCDYQFGDNNISDNCNPMHEYLEGGIHIVIQTVVNQNLCVDSIAQQIFTRTLPIPDFDFQTMNGGCHPDSILFTNLSQNADSYEWNFGDNSTSLLTNPTHFYANADTYMVTLVASIDGICIAEITKTVIVNETPTAVFIANIPPACAELPILFTNNSTGTSTNVAWSFGDGIFSFEDSPSHTFEAAGFYTVQLIVNNGAICADTSEQIIEIVEAVKADFTTIDLICFNEPTGSITVNTTAGTAPFTLNWSGDLSGENPNNLPAGNYQLTITDVNTCSLTTDFTINQPSAITVATLGQTVVGCYGGNDGSLSILASGGVPDYNYDWEMGISGAEISNMEAGDYIVSITDEVGCTQTFPFTILQNAQINIVDTTIHISCFGYGDGEIIIDSIIGGAPIYNLTLEGPVNYEQINLRFGELLPGDYSLTLVDAEGCTENYVYHISEPDAIFVEILQPDTVKITLGQQVDLPLDYNVIQANFKWIPPYALDCDSCNYAVSFPFHDVRYEVTMTDENGCIATDEVLIIVDPFKEVFFPNAFTPDESGYNDVFRIRSNATSIESIENFTVVNRWGETVFHAESFQLNDKVGEWNGNNPQGEKLPPAVYAWSAKIKFFGEDKSTLYKGGITLIR